jgi:1L-myo-inositol 1-phosphate cytidylyltransferase / CDP-L-myo-inositol myo-inositolphosphotransferase
MDRALILTTSGVFERTPEHGRPSPLTMVAGLSLFQRTLLTMQRAGIRHFMVLAGDLAPSLREQLQGDRRLIAEVRWLPTREFPPTDPRTWEILSVMMGGGYLVAGTGAIFSTALITRLREEARARTPVLVARRGVVEKQASAIRLHRQRRDDGVLMVESPVTTTPEPSSGPMLDLVAIPEGFPTTGWASPEDSPHPLQSALERSLRDGQVTMIALGEEWYEDVRTSGHASIADAESVAHAERTLEQSLKDPPLSGLEGFVDRYFNRKCSRWLTRRLLPTSLTPNAVTLVATAVGLVAAGAFAAGGYVAAVVGALLFQFSAILDCCDGEVARLKFLESPFGQQLDLILDNLVHIAIFAGIAWGVSHSTWGSWALLFGGLAIVGNIAAFAVVQAAMRSRTHMDESRRARIDAIFNSLVSRDFSAILLLFALIGQIQWFLFLAAIGSNVFWPFLAWQLRSPNLAREQ